MERTFLHGMVFVTILGLAPDWIDGSGYSTQFMLLSNSTGKASAGNLTFYDQTGRRLTFAIH